MAEATADLRKSMGGRLEAMTDRGNRHGLVGDGWRLSGHGSIGKAPNGFPEQPDGGQALEEQR